MGLDHQQDLRLMSRERTVMAKLVKSGLDKWKDGIKNAVGDPKWNRWDCEIQQAVRAYNYHLRGTPGYVSLDWKLVKAIIWTESGPHKPDWNKKPMQIGNPHDPGLRAFLSDKEGGDLVIVPEWKGLITAGSARTNPVHNIRAGVGYLLMKRANYAHQSILDADDKVYEIKVKAGDSLEKIAKANGSTLEVLQKFNPDAKVLKIGQVVKYQKASVRKVITGWEPITHMFVALKYNSTQGDPDYAEKIRFALEHVQKVKPVQCAP
jgi:LysM repeat protein